MWAVRRAVPMRCGVPVRVSERGALATDGPRGSEEALKAARHRARRSPCGLPHRYLPPWVPNPIGQVPREVGTERAGYLGR